MWGRVSVPTRLVNRGGPGSPLQLLDCALLNTGSASHVHAHTRPQVHTTCSHARYMGAHNPTPEPHIWSMCTHIHICTHACVHTCVLTQCSSCVYARLVVHACTRVHTNMPT